MKPHETPILPLDQSQPLSAMPDAGRSWYYNRLLRASAVVAAGGMLLTGCGIKSPFESTPAESTSSQPAGVSVEQAPTAAENIEPTVEILPMGIRQDFEKAAAVDTCETKVTADEVASVYQRLFMTKEQPGLSIENLQVRAEQVTASFQVAKEKAGVTGLPEKYNHL